MNESTIGIALTATIVAAVIGGRMAGGRTIGINWSFAFAVALGLTLLYMGDFSELARLLQPHSAIEWAPLACLLFAVAQSAKATWRWILSASAGVAIPLRFLWGSVYLQQPDWQAWLAIAAWIAATAALLYLSKPPAPQQLFWSVPAWGVLIAASSLAVLTSGSFTYGVAIGVAGVALLATFLATRTLPAATGALLSALVGLSVAFSNLPLVVALLVVIAATGLSVAPRLVDRPQLLRVSASALTGVSLLAVAVCAAWATIHTIDELAAFSHQGNSGEGYYAEASTDADAPPTNNESLPDPFPGMP